jgi:betaine-aldehyde dehydrogenase
VLKRVVVELPKCARVRDVHEPGKTSSEDQRAKVMGFVERAKDMGIPLLHGGKRSDQGKGVENTAFFDVPEDAEILQEEIFGPVAVSNPVIEQSLRWS